MGQIFTYIAMGLFKLFSPELLVVGSHVLKTESMETVTPPTSVPSSESFTINRSSDLSLPEKYDPAPAVRQNSSSSVMFDSNEEEYSKIYLPPRHIYSSVELTTPTATNAQVEALRNKLRNCKAREDRMKRDYQKACTMLMNYERVLNELVHERDSEREQKEIALKHLANLEFAFADVHEKYERMKTIIEQFRDNETVLKQTLKDAQRLIEQQEVKYQELKNHAVEKLNEANIELAHMKREHAFELIKCGSITI